MQGDAKAIRVPYHATDRVFPQAFSHVAEVRHAQVDAGYRIIGEGAWRNCQHLQIVHLASAVISPNTSLLPLLCTPQGACPRLQAVWGPSL